MVQWSNKRKNYILDCIHCTFVCIKENKLNELHGTEMWMLYEFYVKRCVRLANANKYASNILRIELFRKKGNVTLRRTESTHQLPTRQYSTVRSKVCCLLLLFLFVCLMWCLIPCLFLTFVPNIDSINVHVGGVLKFKWLFMCYLFRTVRCVNAKQCSFVSSESYKPSLVTALRSVILERSNRKGIISALFTKKIHFRHFVSIPRKDYNSCKFSEPNKSNQAISDILKIKCSKI